MKIILYKNLSWMFYYIGDFLGNMLDKEYFSWLYRPYNLCMTLSVDFQDKAVKLGTPSELMPWLDEMNEEFKE
jgi:hypothetical protein